MFELHAFAGLQTQGEHAALIHGRIRSEEPVLLRVHSECLTGEVFGSLRCDCAEQLRESFRRVVAAGSGVIVYLRQEGRGIGLVEKVRAYRLQDQGADTVDANRMLGYRDDERSYEAVKEILDALGVESVVLLTNNPRKANALSAVGVAVAAVESIQVPVTSGTRTYLRTKAIRMGHRLSC